jgi:hypothetical protein
LLVKFKLEENRLINWAKLVKLDYTDESLTFNHMSRMLVLDVMMQQRDLLNKFRELKDKRGYQNFGLPHRTGTALHVDASSNSASENGYTTANGNGTLAIEDNVVQFPAVENEQIVQKALAFLKKYKEIPKRLQWATIHKERMKELIEKLADLNTKMLEALGQGQMETLIGMHTRTNYQLLVMNHRLEQVTQIIQSQQLPSSRHQNRIVDDQDSEYDEIDHRIVPTIRRMSLGALAQSKARNQVLQGSTIDPRLARSLGISQPDDETELSIKDLTTRRGEPLSSIEDDDDDDSKRTEAYYKDTSVWIEWNTTEPFHPGQSSKIEERVKNLAALLKSNSNADENVNPYQFRAPHCLGYFNDEDGGRFGLVFKKPRRASTEAPVTLHSLLTATDADGEFIVPSLADRINLMRLLSETIERLHAVDWLHKGLRSANILFFKDSNTKDINFSNPYISGFEYSRPAARKDMTEKPSDNLASDVYRHPFVQRNNNRGGFKKSHDLYSLGILLFEIAYWKPLDKVLGIDVESPRAKPKEVYQVRDRLLSEPKWLRNIKSHQGDTVEDIIRVCLEDFDEVETDAGAGLQRAFGEKVVARLEQIKGL